MTAAYGRQDKAAATTFEAQYDQAQRDLDSLYTKLRFVDLKSWNEVAASIGGNNTEGSVKQACYRYLKDNAKSVPNVPTTCDTL